MNNLKKSIFAILCIVAMLSVASAASAVNTVPGKVASIWLTDSSNNLTNQFNPGQTVVAHWSAIPVGSTVDINVTDSAGNLVGALSWAGQASSGTVTFTAPAPGYYYVNVNGERLPIAVATLFVLPESALGTFMATGAGFAAFGAVAIVKLKTKKA